MISNQIKAFLADKGDDADTIREKIASADIEAVIPTKSAPAAERSGCTVFASQLSMFAGADKSSYITVDSPSLIRHEVFNHQKCMDNLGQMNMLDRNVRGLESCSKSEFFIP